MPFSVFLSHSMAQDDLGLVYDVAKHVQARGVDCYIAERDYQFGKSLPAKVAANLDRCSCVLAVLTAGGQHSDWVNQEIGYARAKAKLIIPVIEKGVTPSGFLVGLEYLGLDRNDSSSAIEQLGAYVTRLKEKARRDEEFAAAVLVAGVLILLIVASKGSPPTV